MNKFLEWLARSPIATALKVGLAATLGWVLANVETFGLHPVVAIGVTAAIPILINALNPADSRYGVRRKNGAA